MVWKCPPLNLFNWSNLWKWKTEMKYDQEVYEALAENERLHECALYELQKGDKFKIIDDEIKLPPAHDIIDIASEYWFGHIDGMYSFCKDPSGNPVHLAAWTKVRKV
jgi:hypothetical protein